MPERERKRERETPKFPRNIKHKNTLTIQISSLISSIVNSLGGEITFVTPITNLSNDPAVLEPLQTCLQKLSQKLFPNAHRQEVRNSNT
jgi:hypothetical protein